jgi:hypothetical protein
VAPAAELAWRELQRIVNSLGVHNAGAEDLKDELRRQLTEFFSGVTALSDAGVNPPCGPPTAGVLTKELSTEITRVMGLLEAEIDLQVRSRRLASAAITSVEAIFNQHRQAIERLLANTADDVLAKMPSVAERLAAGDREAISHAMLTCRRMLHAFADVVQPPSDEPVNVNGEAWKMDAESYLNRLRYYLRENCRSERRRQRLSQTITGLNDRFSAGAHADVSLDEASALFVLLYITLGELLNCKLSEA